MSRIFVSYRRDDAAGYAGRLFDRLSEVFGRDSVFMDVATIGGGADFVETIENAVGTCDVFVALIGKRWLAADASGRRRLDDEGDFVRLEVATALARDVRFIPVLVDSAAMPGPEELPEDLAALVRRNAVEIANTRWDEDVARLIGSIQEAGVEATPPPFWQRKLGPAPTWLLAAMLALGGVGAATWWGLRAAMEARPADSAPAANAFVPEEVVVRPSLAVLELTSSTGDPESAWLGTAVGEALTTTLGAGNGVRTVPRNEVARAVQDLDGFSGEQLDADSLRSLRARLGVDTVVSGSYTVVGSGESQLVQLDLRLWDALTGEFLAPAGGTGTLTERSPAPSGGRPQLFDLVKRVGADLREKLALGDLTPAQVLAVRATLPAGVQATRYYAEGLVKRRLFDDVEARRLLEAAVETDPNHALSHSELARTLWALGFEKTARETAAKAVELADDLSAADRLAIQAFHHETLEEWGEAVATYGTLYRSHPDDMDLGVKMVSAQIQAGLLDEALAWTEVLRKLPPPASLDPRLDLLEANIHHRFGDYERMLTSAQRAIEGGRAAEMRTLVAEALMLQAIAIRDTGNPQEATGSLDEAAELFAKVGDRRGVARTLENKGHNAVLLGLLRAADRLWERALAAYRNLGDTYGEGRILGALAINRVQQGRLEEAEELNERAMTIYRELGRAHEEAAALNQFGMALHARGKLDSARARYTASLALLSELGSLGLQAIALTNLAELSFLEGKLEEARRLHEDSLTINDEIGDRYGVAYDTYRLGLVLLAAGDVNVARDRLETAIEIQDDIEDALGAAETRLALAGLEAGEGQPAEGEKLARLAEEVARSAGAADLAARAQVVVAACLLKQGKVAEARAAASKAADRAADSEELSLRFASRILDARLAAASGEVNTAIEELREAISEADTAGYVGYRLEATLALGEVLLASGRTDEGHDELARLDTAAGEAGFRRIQRRAAALRAS